METGQETEQNRQRTLLLLLDYVLPVSVGIAMVVLLWQLDISRCRGWSEWDPFSHLKAALRYHGDPSIKLIFDPAYPPLVYFVTHFLFLLMDPGRQAAELSVALFLIPLCLGSYTLGRVYGGRAAGILCLLLPLMNWKMVQLSQFYLLDIPLIATVIWSLIAFQKVGSFQRLGASILLGVALGAGMMAKHNFFFFCAPVVISGVILVVRAARGWLVPAATALVLAGLAALYVSDLAQLLLFKEPSWTGFLLLSATPALALYLPSRLLRNRAVSLKLFKSAELHDQVNNLFLTLAVSLAPCLPWYVGQRDHMFGAAAKNRALGAARDDHAYQCFMSLNIPWAVALPMLLAGVLLIFFAGKRRRELVFVALGGAVAFIFMVESTDCNPRVFLGILPFVQVLGTWWLSLLGWVRWLPVVLVLVVQVVAIYTGRLQGPRYLYLRPRAPGGALKEGFRREIEEDRARCQLDIKTTTLAEELKKISRLDKPYLACIYWDDEQFSASHGMRQFPGFNCDVLGHKLAVRGLPHSTWVLFPTEPHFHVPELNDDDRRRLVLLHIGRHDAPISKIRERYHELTGFKLDYIGFRGLRGPMGVHILRHQGAGR